MTPPVMNIIFCLMDSSHNNTRQWAWEIDRYRHRNWVDTWEAHSCCFPRLAQRSIQSQDVWQRISDELGSSWPSSPPAAPTLQLSTSGLGFPSNDVDENYLNWPAVRIWLEKLYSNSSRNVSKNHGSCASICCLRGPTLRGWRGGG